ncbi:MAG TPA: hypothetical protein VG900_08525 [Hyphomicrobiaceae bacterium]|nr:hypothetical protein [Hyphomicrobiaceae bacterium]
METLKNAERAAGFAMASDDAVEEPKPLAKPDTEKQWGLQERAVSARAEPTHTWASRVPFIAGMLNLLGRGAPA